MANIFVFTLVALVLAQLVYGSHRVKPIRNIFGKRAQRLQLLTREYDGLKEAHSRSDIILFLVALEPFYVHNKHMEKYCSIVQPGIRDLSCIEYSWIKIKVKEMCQALFPRILSMFRDDANELERARYSVRQKITESQQKGMQFAANQLLDDRRPSTIRTCVLLIDDFKSISTRCKLFQEAVEAHLKGFELYRRFAALNDLQEEVSYDWMERTMIKKCHLVQELFILKLERSRIQGLLNHFQVFELDDEFSGDSK